MARELRTAAEIQAEVGRVLHGSREVQADRMEIRVPEPTPLQQPDANGCNWTMGFFGNPGPHIEACAAAMHAVQAKWNLA